MSSSSTTALSSGVCEICGWLAAFCSALAFGSFGVPIKSQAAQQVDIDPLVFQSYKTIMCFLTSWLVLAVGEEFTFSPFGILSGLFWVPGGVATVYAIKAAGLAIGIGIGSSFIVLVSFIWGIFIFNEHVHSRFGACIAILCMMTGLFGMSYFSAPQPQQQPNILHTTASTNTIGTVRDDDDEVTEDTAVARRRHIRRAQYTGLNSYEQDDNSNNNENADDRKINLGSGQSEQEECTKSSGSDTNIIAVSSPEEDFVDDDEDACCDGPTEEPHSCLHLDSCVVLCGCKFTRRQLGMLSALFNGVWGGSITAPMAWAPPDARGTHYLLSFAIGASIVTLSLWVLRYLWYLYRYQCPYEAYQQLPSFHLKVMWLPGATSGLLWSVGNYFSLISVFYLGEGVGYPLVQTAILISGLWGLFYFNEVTGTERRTKWFASSVLTVVGILLLSYEHHKK